MSIEVKCQQCPIWKKSLFKDLDDNLLSWLNENKIFLTKQKTETLFNQDEVVEGIFCHRLGLAKVVQKDKAEKVRFSRLVFPGDTSGHRSLFIMNRYKGTCQIISDEAGACFIPTSVVLQLFGKDVSFSKNLIVKISQELHRSEEEKMDRNEKTVLGRLAQLLILLAEEFSEDIEGLKVIKSEISKRELASLLLVANETIIRLMSEYQRDGVIGYYKKRIAILDLLKLQHLSKY